MYTMLCMKTSDLPMLESEPCSCAQTAGCTFSEDHAWILQELQSSEEYSSYSVASHGRLVAHCDTAAEMNNVRFAYVGLQEIHDWVSKFCEATNLDGQVRPAQPQDVARAAPAW